MATRLSFDAWPRYRPSAFIMSSSDGLILNVHSLPPTPDNSVILGLEAMPSTKGILAAAISGIVANVAEVQCAPTIATTLASISLLATLTASHRVQRLC